MSPVYCECSNDQSPQRSSWKSKEIGNKSLICWGCQGVGESLIQIWIGHKKGCDGLRLPIGHCVLSPLLRELRLQTALPLEGWEGGCGSRAPLDGKETKQPLASYSFDVLPNYLGHIWESSPVRCGLGVEHTLQVTGREPRALPRSIMGTSLDHWGATPIMEGKEKLQRISSSLESVEGTGKTQWRSNSYFMPLQTQITRSSSVQEILPLSTYSSPSVRYLLLHKYFPQGDLNKSYWT